MKPFIVHINDILYELPRFGNIYKALNGIDFNVIMDNITGTKYSHIKNISEECNEVVDKSISSLFDNRLFKLALCNYFSNDTINSHIINMYDMRVLKYRVGDYGIYKTNAGKLKLMFILETPQTGGKMKMGDKNIQLKAGSLLLFDSDAQYVIEHVVKGKLKFFECVLQVVSNKEILSTNKIFRLLTGENIEQLENFIKPVEPNVVQDVVESEPIIIKNDISISDVQKQNSNKIMDDLFSFV